MALLYRSIKYADNHWAVHCPVKSDANFVARFRYPSGPEMAVKVNTTDSRGYRSIIGLVAPDMRSTFNRSYTFEEKTALHLSLGVMSQVYENLGVIAQVEVAGNNSQSFENGQVFLGNDKEPSLLHGHLIGRGNPTHDYIKGVALRGPIPGELFNMREPKSKYETCELEVVRSALAREIKNLFGNPTVNTGLELMEVY